MSKSLSSTLKNSADTDPERLGPKNKNDEVVKEAEKLARLLLRIYKEDYPKIKAGVNKK